MATERVDLYGTAVMLQSERPPKTWLGGVACLPCGRAIFPDEKADFDRDVPPFLEEHSAHEDGKCTLVAMDPETRAIVGYAHCRREH